MDIRSVEAAERRELKIAQPALFRAAMVFLHGEDAAGVGHLSDEYDLEAADIVANIGQCRSAEDVRTLVYEVMRHWFTADIAEPMLRVPLERYAALYEAAKKVNG